jgi:DnaJ domain
VTHPLSRAYAQLGLPPGASLELVRKQYKGLVRRWHPDRFADDPQGQGEASLRMRAINDAYQLLVQRAAPVPDPPSPRPSRARGEPLSREEIDRIVQALGTEGPVDLLLGALRVVGRAVWIPFAVLFVALLGLRLFVALARGEWSVFQADPGFFLLPVVVSVVVTAWYLQLKSQGRRG